MVSRIPIATYRLQFNRQFRFTEAQALVPYLHQLGISDIYTSPLLQARKGSPHGYDVIDPRVLNPELGTGDDFTALAATLKEHHMGLLMDIVPNHLAASPENPWWWDVLRHGRHSPYASCFDIDWQPARSELAGKLLLPVLEEPFGRVLENQQLTLQLATEGLRIGYHEKQFPLSPLSCRRILDGWAEILSRDTSPADPALSQLLNLLASFPAAPPPGAGEPLSAWQEAWQSLRHLYKNQPPVKAFIDANLRKLNGSKGDPQSFSQLESILAQQHYRLVFWRAGREDINYRRFFDVSGLVGVSIEKQDVLAATHALIWQLIAAGQVTGLRIDHIDGLYDPQEYLQRLQEHLSRIGQPSPFYVVVEKILSSDEELPATWPVMGTTGYDFLNVLNGLFVARDGLATLEALYARYSGSPAGTVKIANSQKKMVMRQLFPSEVRNLVQQLGRLAAGDRLGHDLTLRELEEALVEVTASLGIYRTYTRSSRVARADRGYIETAVAAALDGRPDIAPACRFLRRVLLLDYPASLPLAERQQWLQFVMRWQQFTGPVMAKGYEDTCLYIANRLLSLNEVGSDPRAWGTSLPVWHQFNKMRRERRPHTLNATSTHDTKRSEDVRARMNVLAAIPAAWAARLARWRHWNEPRKLKIKGRPVPDSDMELFIYQTLTGAWPLLEEEIPAFKERLRAYLVKAAREAKVHTSWLDPNRDYEDALQAFMTAILAAGDGNRFLPDFREWQKVIAYYGAWNSLAQVLLKITSPGVPDFYQGTELWDFSLVDPDNRRPVDFKKRALLLQRLQEDEREGQLALARKLLAGWHDGRVKLYLTYKSLHFRHEHQELFAGGEYIPVTVTGPWAGNSCAFARQRGREWALVVVPRQLARLQLEDQINLTADRLPDPGSLPGASEWQATALRIPEPAPGSWHNILTGEIIAGDPSPDGKIFTLARALQNFPVALLEGLPV